MAKGKAHTRSQARRDPEREDLRESYLPQGAPYYHIFVRDLVLDGLIGIHPHEQSQPQRLRFNIYLTAEDHCRSTGDDIQNVVSYEDVVEGIKSLLGEGHIGLVETLAERIAAMCLDDERVNTARVRVEKLDVFDEAGSVGIEIERGIKRPYANVNKVIAFGSVPPGKT